MKKPNCYECVHRRDLSGDAHSSCAHPEAKGEMSDVAILLASLASVGRIGAFVNAEGMKALKIEGHPHGIKRGWFNWPYNFDPVWLENCEGFAPRKEREG